MVTLWMGCNMSCMVLLMASAKNRLSSGDQMITEGVHKAKSCHRICYWLLLCSLSILYQYSGNHTSHWRTGNKPKLGKRVVMWGTIKMKVRHTCVDMENRSSDVRRCHDDVTQDCDQGSFRHFRLYSSTRNVSACTDWMPDPGQAYKTGFYIRNVRFE